MLSAQLKLHQDLNSLHVLKELNVLVEIPMLNALLPQLFHHADIQSTELKSHSPLDKFTTNKTTALDTNGLVEDQEELSQFKFANHHQEPTVETTETIASGILTLTKDFVLLMLHAQDLLHALQMPTAQLEKLASSTLAVELQEFALTTANKNLIKSILCINLY